LNTAQTPLFDKGSLLYALDMAKDEIRRKGQVVVVEGYMDAIAAHENGFANVVASMGTALTDRQVRIVKRYTRNLALALDADAAGNEATLRGVQVMADAVDRTLVPVPNWKGLVQFQEALSADIKVLTLPEGRDPDEVIRHDPDTWQRLVEAAQPVIEYMFTAMAGRLDLTNPHDRSQAVEALLPVVASISDKVVQAHYLQRLARLAQVSERTLQDQLPRQGRRRPAGSLAGTPETRQQDPREEYLLALLLQYPELRTAGADINPDLLSISENRAVFHAWREEPDEETRKERLDEHLRDHYQKLLTKRLPPFPAEEARAEVRRCLDGLNRRILEKEKYAHQQLIAESEQLLGANTIAESALSILNSGASEAGDEAAIVAAIAVEDLKTALDLHSKYLTQSSERLDGESVES
jgi:DNA primase